MNPADNRIICSSQVGDNRIVENDFTFGDVILGNGEVFRFPEFLPSPRNKRSLDQMKPEMKCLILDFIGKVSYGQYIRLCGSLGLFVKVKSHCKEMVTIGMIETIIGTPEEFKLPLSVNDASDMDFQVSQEMDEGFLKWIGDVINEYARALNITADCSVSTSSNQFVNVPKKYVDESRHVHGQPTVMLRVQKLQVAIKGDNVLSIDMTEGYGQSYFPTSLRKTFKFDGDEFYAEFSVKVCPLEQLISDMLWAYENTCFISSENKFYYRLRLIAELIDPVYEGGIFHLSQEIRDALGKFGRNSQKQRVGDVRSPSHLLMTQSPCKPPSTTLHPSVKTEFPPQSTPDSRPWHLYPAQLGRFLPAKSVMSQPGVATQPVMRRPGVPPVMRQPAVSTPAAVTRESMSTPTEVIKQAFPIQSDISSHRAVAAQKKAVHDFTFSHSDSVQKDIKEEFVSFRKIIDNAEKKINSGQQRVTISITKDELLFLRRIWDEAYINHMPVEVPAKYGSYYAPPWCVPEISINRKKAREGRQPKLESHLFTIPYHDIINGYTIRLQLYLDGFSKSYGKGTHISLLVYLAKGKNDDLLDWPFNLILTFTLLDQSNTKEPKHIRDSILPDQAKLGESFKRPEGVPNPAVGLPLFAEQKIVFDGDRYVSENDTMLFQLSVHHNKETASP